LKPKTTYQCLLLLFISGLLFFSCAVQQDAQPKTKNGKLYGVVQGAFRHRWWNYFERGLSFAEGGFLDDAISDLTTAIRQRFKDQRMARTYGFHFIDYFPHRELGIGYLLKGTLEKARAELELSLKHFPSAKAYYYLDRVREQLIKRLGHEVAPPKLSLNLKKNVIWTREDPVCLSGVVEDDAFVSGVTIMGRPLFMEGSRKRIDIKEALNLSQGRHDVEVMAINLMGKTTRRVLTIRVDRQGPMITIEDLKRTPNSPTLTISGSLYDQAGTATLQINGESVSLQNDSEAIFSYQLPEHVQTIELIAIDNLGNQTSAQVPVSQTLNAELPVMLAAAGTKAMNMLAASLFGKKDTVPPDIRLKGWTESQTVYLEKIFLEGEIRDNTLIAGLEINQKPILRREGKSIFFNHLAELHQGENNLHVKATDRAGNVAEKTISVNKKVPKALQMEERMRTTIMPFEQKGILSDVSLPFQDNLTNALFNQNRFQIIERQKLDYVLQEQKLSQTDLIEKKTAIRLGKLMASQSIITGSIIETQSGLEIVARMIDTETSEILASKDVFGEEKTLPALKSLSEGMAIKFHQEFPLIDGLVVQKKGKHIFTDIGDPKTKLARRLIVYREDPIQHPTTGKILGMDNTIIGRARVTQVMSDLSKAEVVDGNIDEMKTLDKVITE
jgi:TolB-like protein